VLDFKLADVFQDAKILQRASQAAVQLMKRDPYLEEEENQNLKEYLQQYIKDGMLETTL
jgi:ATP-dependent DNA helicase RecG